MSFFTNNLYDIAKEVVMLQNIVSAYYFNPFVESDISLQDMVEHYTLRWLVHGEADFTVDGKQITLSSKQILICRPCSKVTMQIKGETETI